MPTALRHYFLAASFGLMAAWARAAEPAAEPSPAPPKWFFHGTFRTRIEATDWFQPTGDFQNAYAFSGNRLRINFGQQSQRWDWLMDWELPLIAGSPSNAIAPAPQGQLGQGGSYYINNHNQSVAAGFFPRQAYVNWHRLLGDPRMQLRVGRFEYRDGEEGRDHDATVTAVKRDRVAQRLIGPLGFSHVGRTFDGLHYTADQGLTNLTMIAAIPTRGSVQTDGWGESRVAFGYVALTSGRNRTRGAREFRLLTGYYHDWRHIVKVDNRPLAERRTDFANIKIITLGGHYIDVQRTEAGQFDLLLWGMAQVGRWGRDPHAAAAGLVEIGWQPKDPPRWKPWVKLGYYYGSGDGNPNDREHHTFVPMLPTARIYARFQFFDSLNNRDLHGLFPFQPHARATVRSEWHLLSLASPQDLWYTGGGVFQPWTFGFTGRNTNGQGALANFADTSVEIRLPASTTFTGYFGYAHGRDAIRAVYPKGSNGAFGYVELLYRF